jgi:hypothetical protein
MELDRYIYKWNIKQHQQQHTQKRVGRIFIFVYGNKKTKRRKVEKHGTNQSGTPNEKWIIIIVIIV